MAERKLLTAKELGTIFNVSARTVCKWYREGRIEGVKPTASTLRFPWPQVLPRSIQALRVRE